MSLSRRNQRLVDRYGGQVVRFKDLPVTAKLALIHYLAVQHEAWTVPASDPVLASVRYGNVPFGIVQLPLRALTTEVMRDPELTEHGTFAKYHHWYMAHGPVTRHPLHHRWPIILSDFEDETIDDGWHRFHDYYRAGASTVTAIWFA